MAKVRSNSFHSTQADCAAPHRCSPRFAAVASESGSFRHEMRLSHHCAARYGNATKLTITAATTTLAALGLARSNACWLHKGIKCGGRVDGVDRGCGVAG